jgi:hypothetical protein
MEKLAGIGLIAREQGKIFVEQDVTNHYLPESSSNIISHIIKFNT